LLNTRIVTSFLGRFGVGSVTVLLVVDIAHIPLRDILGRLLCGGGCFGWRSRGTVRYLVRSADYAGACFGEYIRALRAAGDARPGPSEVLESWRAKDPYGLLSSSSHILLV
jgi:hypothetical protein